MPMYQSQENNQCGRLSYFAVPLLVIHKNPNRLLQEDANEQTLEQTLLSPGLACCPKQPPLLVPTLTLTRLTAPLSYERRYCQNV